MWIAVWCFPFAISFSLALSAAHDLGENFTHMDSHPRQSESNRSIRAKHKNEKRAERDPSRRSSLRFDQIDTRVGPAHFNCLLN